MVDKVLRRRESKAKDTEKLNTDIEVKYMRMLEKIADGSRFRNKTHAIEVAIETLYDMVLASEEKEG